MGIDQLLTDVGISKTAFYKHFESKDDLVLAVLEHQDRWLRETFLKLIRERGGPSPIGQLKASFDVVEQIIDSQEFRGCFFVNVAMEFPLAHDPAHQAAAANKQAIQAILVELAERAGAADPQALAEELCLVMEGAYVTRQVTGNPKTASIARRLAERIIASAVPT